MQRTADTETLHSPQHVCQCKALRTANCIVCITSHSCPQLDAVLYSFGGPAMQSDESRTMFVYVFMQMASLLYLVLPAALNLSV